MYEEQEETAPPPPGTDPVEERDVERWQQDYKQARKHDEAARGQYARDRRYAAGTADPRWAVDTNLIGSHIDILTAYLYAKNPDVSTRPAEHVDFDASRHPVVQQAREMGLEPVAQALQQQLAGAASGFDLQDFAKSLQTVIARAWKSGRLKKRVRKQVRSTLSVGIGWLKAVMRHDYEDDPLVAQQLNELRDNMSRVYARVAELRDGNADDELLEIERLEQEIAGLEPNLEVLKRKGMVFDFVPAQSIQVSTDVADIEDYLDASWIAHELYMPKSEACAEFYGRLTKEDIERANFYHPRTAKDELHHDPLPEAQGDQTGAEAAERYANSDGRGGHGSGAQDVEPHVKVIELWDRNNNVIRTMLEGVNKWAREPYAPNYATTRFYPFFGLIFFPVDGLRHPQSVTWRAKKLQDEYASRRSAKRRARERSVPGVLFNETLLDQANADKLAKGTDAEYVGIKPQTPKVRLQDLFAAKPLATIDPSLYETNEVHGDLEKVTGVQEAKQSSAGRNRQITATEATLEESGFAARTFASTDAVEEMLQELAQYTGELCLQAYTPEEARRIAGPGVIWPEQMSPEELTDLVEVEIEAGSTGRPNTNVEREAWTAVLPLIRQDVMAITEALLNGQTEIARVLKALLQETLNRMGSRIDVERFIPNIQPAPMVPAPGAAGAPGGPAPAVDPGEPEPPPPGTVTPPPVTPPVVNPPM